MPEKQKSAQDLKSGYYLSKDGQHIVFLEQEKNGYGYTIKRLHTTKKLIARDY